MRHESSPPASQPGYILKILAGLLTLALLGFCALWLPESGVSAVQHSMVIAALLVFAVALVPAVYWVLRRRDELQRLQHQQASANAIAVLAATSAAVGVLQANQWLPLFNQFWALGLLLAVWGVQLMWADRRFR